MGGNIRFTSGITKVTAELFSTGIPGLGVDARVSDGLQMMSGPVHEIAADS